jgi:hypothetical protein
VDEARHELALLYLGDTALTMTERWTGSAPSAMRR